MVGIVESVPFGGGSGQRRCSFCGRRGDRVTHLVRARGSAYICDGCVAEAQQAIASADPGERLLRIRPTAAQVPDRDEAERSIEQAFETAFDPAAPVADRCAAIEGGTNLAATMQELAERYPPARDLDVVVDHVRFLDDDEAQVHFVLLGVQFGPSGFARAGHARRTGDRWKVARDTWCGLVSLAGVHCPPRDDRPGG